MKPCSFFLILFLLSSAASDAQPATEVISGELNGSPYTIALPADWQSGHLFFHVHGWRVIAKGAFVNLKDREADSYLEATPAIPAILMSNLTELDGPVAYVASAEHAPVRPVLRPLLNPGHVNVNWMERRDAFLAMTEWLDGSNPDMITEGTRKLPARETGTVQTETKITNRVISINPFFGNAFIGFHPDELAAWGLQRGDYFLIETDGELRRVYYGQSYGDVPLGEWVAFPTASDTILLARNHENAVETATLSPGDEVSFLKLKTEK